MHQVLVTLNDFLKKPKHAFWLFALAHFCLWIVVPALVDPNAPPDVIEGYAWGHELALGSYKHPPLQAWLLEIAALLTGRARLAHLFLTQVSVIAALWAVWQTGCRMMSARAALVGVMLLEGIAFYNFDVGQFNPFNPNLLQMAFWALMANSFHKAMKENETADWCWLGLWTACGLYSKYSALLLVLVFAAFLAATEEGRKKLKSRNPYIALGIALILFSPHIVWLFQHDFLPFTYVASRFERPARQPYFFWAPVNYLNGQFLRFLPALAIFLAAFGIDLARGKKNSGSKVAAIDKKFLDFILYIPPLTVLVLATGTGHKIPVLWSTPFWNFAGLWAMARLNPALTLPAMERFVISWLFVFIAAGAGYAAASDFYPLHAHKPRRVDFPGPQLAAEIDRKWHAHYASPLAYIIGDPWTAGNVSFYGPDWPHVLINGDFTENPTIQSDQLARKGGIVVWCIKNCYSRLDKGMGEDLLKKFPEADRQQPFIVPWRTKTDVPPLHIGWAIVPPASD